jgi:hypothetical protein
MNKYYRYCFLIRDPNDEYGEKTAMSELKIPFIESRSQELPVSDIGLVMIGRYSVLPYYRELEKDLLERSCGEIKLINSHQQFKYVADLQNWYQDLSKFTPKTWFTLQEYLADIYEGPVILKGETNSRRDKWLTHMFALNKDEAREVYCRLMDDGLISQQKIYIRKYEPLKKLIDGVNGMPIPNEWRIFICYGKMISCSYYWGTYLEDIEEKGIKYDIPLFETIEKFVKKIGDKSNFYSLDIAQKENGEWIVIELNEGQQSGLNGINPLKFYTALKKILDTEKVLSCV